MRRSFAQVSSCWVMADESGRGGVEGDVVCGGAVDAPIARGEGDVRF